MIRFQIRVFALFAFAVLLPLASFSADSPGFYSDYSSLLQKYVDERAMVDYRSIRKNPELLNKTMTGFAQTSEKVYNEMSDEQKIAFWINAYNAFTIRAIVDHYPIEPGGFLSSLRFPDNSIRQIPGVWKKLKFSTPLGKLTLHEIEHDYLRPRFDEPRIHVAIVCAAHSCPPLRSEAYIGEKLEEQLNDQAERFFERRTNFRIDKRKNEVHLSEILDWFKEDFVSRYGTSSKFKDHGKEERAVLNFIINYVDADAKKYLEQENYDIEYVDYDWRLNEQ